MTGRAEQMHSSATTSPRSDVRPQRVLACLLCQQRKTKCDRNFPCATCTKSGAQCIPVAAPRQRRRRFPEKELLERVRHLEGLLRQHNVDFEPLHTPVAGEPSPNDHESPSAGRHETEPIIKEEINYEARNLWQAMNSKSGDTETDDEHHEIENVKEDLRDAIGKKAWDQLYQNSTDYLLFGSRIVDIDLSLMHPDLRETFKLWQIYLDNVNPLFRVTHTPTLQARIIDAAGALTKIEPVLESLMFGVYCTAVMSIPEDKCNDFFGASKGDLIKRFSFGCQQALLKSGVLHTDDSECLTALFLYMVAVRPETDPRSLSSLLGLAMRIAQRMGLDKESTYEKCNALDAEMRRRLWWALVLLDNRICEMSDYRAATLIPTWDVKALLNVNDHDMRSEMRTAPSGQDGHTEATFVVLRSQVADLVRHTGSLLDFVNPSLKRIANPGEHGGSLEALEKIIEDKYLRSCNPDIPLQFLTIWATRGNIARYHLFRHFSVSSTQETEAKRETAVKHALHMLECDTKLTTSPLTEGYRWFFLFHFPFPAYVYILQYLRKNPFAQLAERGWNVMSDNCKARFANPDEDDHPFHKTPIFQAFTSIILKAWQVREAASGPNETLSIPPIITEFKRRAFAPPTADQSTGYANQSSFAARTEADDFRTPMMMGWGGQRMMQGFGDDGSGMGVGMGAGGGYYADLMGGENADGSGGDQFGDWSMADWNAMRIPGL